MDQLNSGDPSACRRCGACCEQGGPALHGEDRAIIDSGAIAWRDLVTIRPGEPAYDQRRGQVLAAEQEFVKLVGGGGSWRCKFYRQDLGCGIYGQRPLECRLLLCRATGPLEAVMGRDLLSRRDLLAGDGQFLPWLARLEREVAYLEIGELLAGLAPHRAHGELRERLTGLVRADLAIRAEFLRSFPAQGSEELFLLGRPLFLVIAPYGFRLVEGPDGVGLHYSGPGC